MGASTSKIEEDKALALCQERKRFVRAALNGRSSFAAAQLSYVQSLRNTGIAIGRLAVSDARSESSMYASTSATPELPASPKNPPPRSAMPSLSSPRQADTVGTISSVPLSHSSRRSTVNYMKAGPSSLTTVEQKPPVPVVAKVVSSSADSRHGASDDPRKHLASEASPSQSDNSPWDYFFSPVGGQTPFPDVQELSDALENVDYVRQYREKEGIPDLEEEDAKFPTLRGEDFGESEDDFDRPSVEPLIRMFKNRNIVDRQDSNVSLDIYSSEDDFYEHEWQMESAIHTAVGATDESPQSTPIESVASVSDLPKRGLDKAPSMPEGSMYGSPAAAQKKFVSSTSLPTMNGKSKETTTNMRMQVKDFSSYMKEVERLFITASDAGKEVPRMLEAEKVYVPILPNEAVQGPRAFSFITTCVGCFTGEGLQTPVPAPTDMKYLTWHRAPSLNSPHMRTVSNEINDFTENAISTVYMNSGSHASTLDRLYAWEQKLYDEVKASGVIRREYDMRCRLLRHQESIQDDQFKIDRNRAAVKDLHSRIHVAIQRIHWISKKIDDIRDNELQPQLEELIGSLTQMWEMMLNCHQNQHQIAVLASKQESLKSAVWSESQRQALIYVEVELKTLSSNFTKLASSHKSYLSSLESWLHKCVIPLQQKSSRRRSSNVSLRNYIGPPIFVTCEDWLKLVDELPVKQVEESIKDVVAVTASLLPYDEKHHADSKPAFASLRMGRVRTKKKEGIHNSDSPTVLSRNSEDWQLYLGVLFEQLKNLSESSFQKYQDLQKKVARARDAYTDGNGA